MERDVVRDNIFKALERAWRRRARKITALNVEKRKIHFNTWVIEFERIALSLALVSGSSRSQ